MVVKRYALIDCSFKLAWEALKPQLGFNIPTASEKGNQSILDTLHVSTFELNPILVHITSIKLPREVRALWQHFLKPHKEVPTFEQMDLFVISIDKVVERINSVKTSKKSQSESMKIQYQSVGVNVILNILVSHISQL